MRYTQFLIFELGHKCNLAHVHKLCPSASPERFANVDTSRELTDDMIVRTAVRMYQEFGFRGLIGWHYYNEPTIQRERMMSLMARIKSEVSEARFVLWTNGTHILSSDEMDAFDQIHVTDYTRDGNTPLVQIADHEKSQVHHWPLDSRLNLFTDDLDVIADSWLFVRDEMTDRMTSGAPEVCQQCSMRPQRIHINDFVPEIAEDTRRYLSEIATPVPRPNPDRQIGVVFPSYRIPVQRLVDHFKWNDAIYREVEAKVFVVVEEDLDAGTPPEGAMPFPAAVMDLPEYVTLIQFDESDLPVIDGKPAFSIAKTKNRGIEAAIRNGCELIIATDVDVTLDAEAWAAAMRVTDYSASVPLYRMADSHKDRKTKYIDAPNATGTVTMTANNWREVRYDERMVGYGCDDGAILYAMGIHGAGLTIDRTGVAYHVAHVEGSNQSEFNGRSDHWNRGSGFNFKNFAGNGKIFKESVECG